jgi:serine/threonine-protein kinase RsbW
MGSEVVLTVPAQTSFVSLVRTATAAICAKADFTIDRLEDLRLAMDEACAIVISDAAPDTRMTVTWHVSGPEVRMQVCAISASGHDVPTNTFSWTVLSALVDSVSAVVDADAMTLTMTARGIESVAL